MDFKKISLIVGFTALCGVSNTALATGIPVFCYNCQEASHNAAHSVIDAIRSQTEALLNGMDYTMRNNQTVEMVAEQERQRIQNNRDMNVSMGAKPRPACGQAAAASIRGASASAGVKTRNVLAQAVGNYNMRNRELAPKEPRRAFAIQEVMTRMDDKEYKPGVLLLERVPVDGAKSSELQKKLSDTLLITNPFPVEVPSAEDIKRIKTDGSPGEKESLARSIAMAKRQEFAQHSIVKEFEANIQRIDPEGIKYMLDEIKPYLTADEQAKLNGKLSANQLAELLATYRVRSPQWVKYLSTNASQLGVAKEQTLILAEVLNQLYEMNNVNRDIRTILSMTEIRETTQAGLQSR